MPIEITPIFLILAAIIGLLIGLLVANLFSAKDSKQGDQKTPPVEMTKQGFAEAARLWYSPAAKKVITELDGAYYRDFLTLSPEQKNRINTLLESWSDWAGGISDGEPVKLYTPVVQNKPPEDDEELPPIGPVLDWSVAEAIKTKEADDTPMLSEADKPKTIAGQISLILDKMLEGNPLKEKGIRLIENNHHGVDVWIGLEKYDGLDAIPFPEVQQFIRAAVAQWEREMEAGKTLV